MTDGVSEILRRTARLLAAAALAFAGTLASAAPFGPARDFPIATEPGSDAELRLLLPPGAGPDGAFVPARMRIVNRSSAERRWKMAAKLGAYGGYGGVPTGLLSQHEFVVPGGTSRDFFIFMPAPSMGSYSLTMEADISGPGVTGAPVHLNAGTQTPGGFASIAVQNELGEAFRRTSVAQLPSGAVARPHHRGRYYHGTPHAINVAEHVGFVDVAVWPADWRVWSSYDVLLLDAVYWETLGDAYRRAILDWVAIGGRLCLSPSARGERAATLRGLGEIVTLGSPLADADAGDFETITAAARGNETADLVLGRFSDIKESDWRHAPPARWITFFLVGFGLLVGPVNLFYFAPAGRRHRLFATIPAISVGTALLLGSFILIRDGFGGEGARRAVVVLLPEDNQAVVVQQQVARTGMLAARSFTFPADAAIVRYDAAPTAVGMERTNDRASGDWFASRSTQLHFIRQIVPTRERVELLSGPAGAPIVQSTVTPALRDFVYRSEDGNFFHAEQLPPGERVTLQPRQMDAGSTDPRVELRPGMFRAEGTGSSLAPVATLASIEWRDDTVLYIGRLQPPSTP